MKELIQYKKINIEVTPFIYIEKNKEKQIKRYIEERNIVSNTNTERIKLIFQYNSFDIYIIQCIQDKNNILHCILKSFNLEYQENTEDRKNIVLAFKELLLSLCTKTKFKQLGVREEVQTIQDMIKNEQIIDLKILELVSKYININIYIFDNEEGVLFSVKDPSLYVGLYYKDQVYNLLGVICDKGIITCYNNKENPIRRLYRDKYL